MSQLAICFCWFPCIAYPSALRIEVMCSSEMQGCLIVALLATCFHAVFLLGLFFNLEDEDDMILQNVD
jgi:hypothetical protein